MTEIVMAVTGILSVFATGFAGWFFGRRKTQAEAHSTEIDNDVKLSNHYKEILDDLKSRYEERYKEFESLMLKKEELLKEELKLKDKKIRLQQQEINELRKEVKILTKEKEYLISADGSNRTI
jgi:hypothetical protein